jgi:hypothetical protein
MKSASSSDQMSAVRQVRCERCGESFGCGLSKSCWCAQEEFKLPLPTDADDCLCPRCLKEIAAQGEARKA